MAARPHHLRKSLRTATTISTPAPAPPQSDPPVSTPPVIPLPPPQPPGIPVAHIESYLSGWIIDGQYSSRSEATLTNRKRIVTNLLWWCKHCGIETIDRSKMKSFLGYVANGTPRGRWGDPRWTNDATKSTNTTYYGYLRAFFGWIHDQELIDFNPMDRVDRPGGQVDPVQPFSDEQVLDILQAAEKTSQPRRDLAIVWILFDTGMRVSELCALVRGDVNVLEKSITILKGKGKKRRTLYFGQTAGNALWRSMRESDLPDSAPLFPAYWGPHEGEMMDRHAVKKLLYRLNELVKEAQISRGEKPIGVPGIGAHKFRHTFAVSFLRNGGNVYELMRLLGHTSLTMSMRYANIAQCDVAAAHRRNSPADRLRSKYRSKG